MMLYKYRSLDNLKFLIDIFMNSQLYAAKYTEMNDPMEGHYFNRSGKLSEEFKSALRGEKDSHRICSLSEIPDNQLMWAHYANGHNGIAIGVEVDETQNYDVCEVQYKGLTSLSGKFDHAPAEAAKQVLSHKLEIWDYEKEHRVFVPHDMFVKVHIKEVIFGRRVSYDDYYFFKALFTKLAGELDFKKEQDL